MDFPEYLSSAGLPEHLLEATMSAYKASVGSPVLVESVSDLRKQVSQAAMNRHEYSNYDEWEQRPYIDKEDIEQLTDEEFVSVVGQDAYRDDLSDEEIVDMIYKWYKHLCDKDLMGFDYTWGEPWPVEESV